MKYNKLLVLATTCIIATTPALAGGSSNNDDSPRPASAACMVSIEDSLTYRQINVEYIRLLRIDKKDPLRLIISTASNYSNNANGGNGNFEIGYPTAPEARAAMDELADRITYCRENAQQRRQELTTKMKK